MCRRSTGRGPEVGNTAGISTGDSSYNSTRMLKYDEYYSIKSKTGIVPTENKKRREKVEMAI